MFGYCCAMMNYKLLLLLLILPHIGHTKTVKPRKRPLLEHLTPTAHPLVDQIALATQWKAPNRIISASYSSHPETGRVNHANLMVRLLPHEAPRPIVDMAASETLSNSKTAAEYVSKAINMRHKLHDKAPHSTYVKYDVYEKEQQKHIVPTQLETPMRYTFTQDEAIPRSSKGYQDYENEPVRNHNYGSMKQDQEVEASYSRPNIYSNIYKNFDETSSHTVRQASPNSDALRHFQHSIMKYMKEKEMEEKLAKMPKIRPTPIEHVRTYYRIPSDLDTGNIYKEMRNKAIGYGLDPVENAYSSQTASTLKSPTKISYTTIRPYLDELHTTSETKTPNVDLTFRSKTRPKPIDLAALDVGQTWTHGSSFDTNGKRFSEYDQIQSMSAHNSKPKLHFNSQSYHDINALSSLKTKTPTYPDDYLPGPYSDIKLGENMASVGASISVGKHHVDTTEETIKDLQKHYGRQLEIINGIPVSNPYMLNMETLKEMFSTAAASNNEFNGDPENWHPYHISTSPSYYGPNGQSGKYMEDTKEKDSTYRTVTHYDESYDIFPSKLTNEEDFDPTKFKNTNGWEPLNHRPVKGHKSSSNHSSYDLNKNTTNSKSKKSSKGGNGGGTTTIRVKGGKVKIKKGKGSKNFATKKSRELDTELRPPPYK